MKRLLFQVQNIQGDIENFTVNVQTREEKFDLANLIISQIKKGSKIMLEGEYSIVYQAQMTLDLGEIPIKRYPMKINDQIEENQPQQIFISETSNQEDQSSTKSQSTAKKQCRTIGQVQEIVQKIFERKQALKNLYIHGNDRYQKKKDILNIIARELGENVQTLYRYIREVINGELFGFQFELHYAASIGLLYHYNNIRCYQRLC